MRFATFSVAGTFLVAILVMAMWPASAKFGSPRTGIAQEETSSEPSEKANPSEHSEPMTDLRKPTMVQQRIATSADADMKLQKLCSFDYDETPFSEVMADIRDRYQLNVLLDQTAKDDSLTEEEFVTFRIDNVSMATALRLMLAEKNATYMIQYGILRIISLDVANEREFFRRKIFDCRQLLENIAVTDQRVGKQHARGGGGGRFGGGLHDIGYLNRRPFQTAEREKNLAAGLGSVTHMPSNPRQTVGQAANMANNIVSAASILEDVIRTSVEPKGWENTGGDGTLKTVSGFMVVSQQQKALDEIETLIIELETRFR